MNEAPTSLDLSGTTITGSKAGTVIGTLTGTDPDKGAQLSYRLINDAAGRFVVNSTTGVISIAQDAVFDFKGNPVFNITARVTDQDGLYYDKVFSINSDHQIIGTNANDIISGTVSNDTITGGLGNDTIKQDGNDVVVYPNGDGNDTITGTSSGNLMLQFANSVAANRIKLQIVNGADLLVSIAASAARAKDAGSILLKDFGKDNQLALNSHLQISFADGTLWSGADIYSKVHTFAGSVKNDKIIGSYSDDTITGGLGNDYLIGNGGSDVFVYGNGDGNDVIAYNGGRLTTIRFANGIDTGRVKLQSDRWGNVIIFISSSTPSSSDAGSIVLNGYGNLSLADLTNQLQLNFADGTLWAGADLYSKVHNFIGTDNNDKIIGSGASDTITGGLGNDYLIGYGGNDVFVYSNGDGNDVIAYNGIGLSTLKFSESIDASRVKLITDRRGNVIVSIASSDAHTSDAGSVVLKGYGNLSLENLTSQLQLSFADGTNWSGADLYSKIHDLQGTNWRNKILGSGAADTITGGLGNDYLYGGLGGDTFIFHKGDGKDVISDFVATGAGHDILQLDPALVKDWTDLLSKTKQSGSDVVIAANTNDLITLKNVSLASLSEDNFRFQA